MTRLEEDGVISGAVASHRISDRLQSRKDALGENKGDGQKEKWDEGLSGGGGGERERERGKGRKGVGGGGGGQSQRRRQTDGREKRQGKQEEKKAEN